MTKEPDEKIIELSGKYCQEIGLCFKPHKKTKAATRRVSVIPKKQLA